MDRRTLTCWLLTALVCVLAGASPEGGDSGAPAVDQPLSVASLSLRDERNRQVLLVRSDGLSGHWSSTGGPVDLTIGDKHRLTIGSGRRELLAFGIDEVAQRRVVRLGLGESRQESLLVEIADKDKARIALRNGGTSWSSRSDGLELVDASGSSGVRLGLAASGHPEVSARSTSGGFMWNLRGLEARDAKDRTAAILGEQNDQGWPHLRIHHDDGSVHGWMKAPSWKPPLTDARTRAPVQIQESEIWQAREGAAMVLRRADGQFAVSFLAGGYGYVDAATGRRSAIVSGYLLSGCGMRTSFQAVSHHDTPLPWRFVTMPYTRLRAVAAFHQEK